jgi:hypothetical protein
MATPLTLVSIDPRGCASALPEPYRPPRLAGHRSQTRRGLLRFLSPRERQHLLAARRTASSHVCHLRALLVNHAQHLTRPVLPAESRPRPLSRALPRCCGRRPIAIAGPVFRVGRGRPTLGPAALLGTPDVDDHHRPKDPHTACRCSLRPALPHGTAGSAATCWPDVRCLVSPPEDSLGMGSTWRQRELQLGPSPPRTPSIDHVQSELAPREDELQPVTPAQALTDGTQILRCAPWAGRRRAIPVPRPCRPIDAAVHWMTPT